MSAVGNRLFFIGLILLTFAVIVGMPALAPVGAASVTLIIVGLWLCSKPSSSNNEGSIPLSQQSARNKMLVGIPALALIAASFFVEPAKNLIQGGGLFFLAYAIAGLVEVGIDRYFPNAKQDWCGLHPIFKLIISISAIALSLIMFGSLIMFIGQQGQM